MSEHVENLELRLKRIESYIEIVNLLGKYGRYCDGGWDRPSHNYERLCEEVFSETCTWEAENYPKKTGTEDLRELFKNFAETIQFASHILVMPIIRFNDDVTEAIGMIDLIGAGKNTLYEDTFACRGYYSMKFRLTEKGWRIEHLINRNHIFENNCQGWVWDNRRPYDEYPDLWGSEGPDNIKVRHRE